MMRLQTAARFCNGSSFYEWKSLLLWSRFMLIQNECRRPDLSLFQTDGIKLKWQNDIRNNSVAIVSTRLFAGQMSWPGPEPGSQAELRDWPTQHHTRWGSSGSATIISDIFQTLCQWLGFDSPLSCLAFLTVVKVSAWPPWPLVGWDTCHQMRLPLVLGLSLFLLLPALNSTHTILNGPDYTALV